MYGGPTPKRHVAYSTSPAISRLDLGQLRGWAEKTRKLAAAGVERPRTVEKYVDKKGKQRFKGGKGLKPSESETYLFIGIIDATKHHQTYSPSFTCGRSMSKPCS